MSFSADSTLDVTEEGVLRPAAEDLAVVSIAAEGTVPTGASIEAVTAAAPEDLVLAIVTEDAVLTAIAV